MSVVDYGVIAIVVISALVGLVRGFVREAMSLLVWGGAFLMAFFFADNASPLLENTLSDEVLRFWVAAAAVFFVSLIIGGIINYLINHFLKTVDTGFVDRVLGVVLGILRGVLVITVLVLAARVPSLPLEKWWPDSEFLPHFQQAADWLWEAGQDSVNSLREMRDGETPSDQPTSTTTPNNS